MELGKDVLELAVGLTGITLASAVTDLGVAALAAEAAVVAAGYNVRVNLSGDVDPALVAEARPKAKQLEEEAHRLAAKVREHVESKLG